MLITFTLSEDSGIWTGESEQTPGLSASAPSPEEVRDQIGAALRPRVRRPVYAVTSEWDEDSGTIVFSTDAPVQY